MNAAPAFRHLSRTSAVIGVVLLLLCAATAWIAPRVFFDGYLNGFVFWVEIALGCLFLLLIQNLTGGRWGLVVTRLLEAGMGTLPLCAVLFLPVLAGMSWLYPWVHPVAGETGRLIHAKAAYLNVPFYVARAVVTFAILAAMAGWLRTLSLRRATDPAAVPTMQWWSGPLLIVFVLLMNFASIDWVMSLNPEWYSSMFVVAFVSEQSVVVVAWCLLILHFLNCLEPMRRVLTVKVVHDLGNLLLGFICFWTYVTFMEYIIIWTGDLPHDVVWFVDRSSPGWKIFAVVLILLHFVVPLFCLIFTAVSKSLERLARVAGLVLVAHFAQVTWWIEPAFGKSFHVAWTTPLLIVAIGGIWLAGFLRHLGTAPLLVPELEPKKEAVPA
jgi:hypothetical protein